MEAWIGRVGEGVGEDGGENSDPHGFFGANRTLLSLTLSLCVALSLSLSLSLSLE